MKIVNLVAENVKRVKAIDITPTGHVVEVRGKNGAGKSSVLDSIMYGLAGGDVLPSQPIRRGAETARIQLDLGELLVTRRFTAAGSTVVVEAASGARFRSPQHMLNELIGALTFDPLAFTRLAPAKQLESLRRLVPLEVDIDALDGLNEKDYETRTEVNREARKLRGQASGIQYPADLPSAPIDVAALTERLRQAGDDNAQLVARKARRERTAQEAHLDRQTARQRRERADQLHREAAELEQEAERLESSAAEAERQMAEAAPLPDPVDTGELVAALEAARATNANLENKARRETLEAEAASLEARSAGLTAAMEERTQRKTAAIAAAKMPVAGLSFGDGEVLFDGIPLDQASQAEKIRVSVAIAMAANPKVRVLCVRDGSLLDRESWRLLGELVASNDYQCWIEVTDDEGKTGIVIEDGSVVREPDPEKARQPSLALVQV
jgi:cytoskeletal protein RodZ